MEDVKIVAKVDFGAMRIDRSCDRTPDRLLDRKKYLQSKHRMK